MGFTRFTDNVSIHQSMADEPNVDDGLSAEQLKAKFDEPAEKTQTAINNLMSELEAKDGASSIGAYPLAEGDTSEANVGAKLSYLLEEIQGTSMGQVPDGSITKTKLASDFSEVIAEKDGSLQTNLNAEKLGGKMLDELMSYFVVTGGYTIKAKETKTINLGFTPRAVLISGGVKDYGNYAVMNDTYLVTTEKPIFKFYENKTSADMIKIVDGGFEHIEPSAINVADYGDGYRYIAFR